MVYFLYKKEWFWYLYNKNKGKNSDFFAEKAKMVVSSEILVIVRNILEPCYLYFYVYQIQQQIHVRKKWSKTHTEKRYRRFCPCVPKCGYTELGRVKLTLELFLYSWVIRWKRFKSTVRAGLGTGEYHRFDTIDQYLSGLKGKSRF